MSERYIGVYNYRKNGLPTTKMVGFDSNKELVVEAVKQHAEQNQYPLDSYHISTYECADWSDKTKDIPQKVSEEAVS